MAEEESTHEVAEKTTGDGTKVRTEHVKTETTEVRQTTVRGPESEGEPKQVKPDGR